jgi:hypothetical protein
MVSSSHWTCQSQSDWRYPVGPKLLNQKMENHFPEILKNDICQVIYIAPRSRNLPSSTPRRAQQRSEELREPSRVQERSGEPRRAQERSGPYRITILSSARLLLEWKTMRCERLWVRRPTVGPKLDRGTENKPRDQKSIVGPNFIVMGLEHARIRFQSGLVGSQHSFK